MNAPDQDIKPVWNKMTDDEKKWYIDFHRATKRHDWKALRRLCDLAPSADHDRLYREISYELSHGSRMQMPPRDQRKARFNEFDYGWEQPGKETPSSSFVLNSATGGEFDSHHKRTKVRFGNNND